jgi:tetratricopeptide (TPR) repeat protein
MADITNVNLVWLRKVRGVAPLARYALQADGSLLASVPDDLEARTFHVARFDGTTGRSQIVQTYNVETLRKTEIGASGQTFVGATDDDFYLFQNGRKARFLADRRAAYTDIALGETGQRFAAALCDLLLNGNTIALGDIAGRLLWTKDIPFPVSRLSVDRDARHIAVAGETGDLLVLDAARNVVVSHRQEAALTAVATVGPALTVFAGGGGVGAINESGALLWFTEVQGEILELALSGDGETVAVLSRLDETAGRLVFLSQDGLPTWDVDFDEARPTGLSLSPDGSRAAVTLRDGSISLFALEYGQRLAGADAAQVLAEAQSALTGGSPRTATDLLRARLDAVPSDTLACEMLARALDALRAQTRSLAETAEAVGDFAQADRHLADLCAALPFDTDATSRRAALRGRWAAAARTAGETALAASNGAEAEARLLEAIAADPLDVAARDALAQARASASAGALRRGTEQLALGHFGEAIGALAEAQARGASAPEVGLLLRQARAGEALALGNRLYQDRQYAAALFQFKKVLRMDPANPEALQKIGYAQNFLQDTQLSDRFSRLE